MAIVRVEGKLLLLLQVLEAAAKDRRSAVKKSSLTRQGRRSDKDTASEVSRLDAKIEGDMNREKAKSDAFAKAAASAAEREADSLRTSLRKAEAELLASRGRERQAAEDAAAASAAPLRAELVAARDAAERAERSLGAALERARVAEAAAERAARAAQQDKDTLKRGLVASQTACAELRAERSRLLSELDHAASSAAVAAAAAAAAAAPARSGSSSSFSSPTGFGHDNGGVRRGKLDGDDSPAVAAAAGSGAPGRTRTDLEGRLALALAEAAEARAEVERLKRKVEACEREHEQVPVVGAAAAAGASARRRRRHGGGALSGQESHLNDGNQIAGGGGGFHGDENRARHQHESLHDALQESCWVMGRVATALSSAVNGAAAGDPRSSGGGGGGGSALDDPRWATDRRSWRRRRRSAAGARHRSLTAAAAAAPITQNWRRRGDTRRRRAVSVDSLQSGRAGDGRGLGDSSEWGDEDDEDASDEGRRGVSRAEVRDISERLRFEASRLLGVRMEEQKTAEDKVARLKQDLRDSEAREAEATARLEESRELSREQTGFVEGVWKERRRLESELAAHRGEVARLRAGEDAARAAAAVLDGKVEDLSTALRQEQARARREAEAAVAAEARGAMEALRRQLDDLRKEVDRTKQGQGEQRQGQEQDREGGEGGGGGGGGALNLDGPTSAFSATERAGARGGRRMVEPPASSRGAVSAPPSASPPSLVVLEGEFQRLRAKYEKAKGRIAALEELVAASRRVSAQARHEFQGALEALKLSQELLLKIHRQRQGREKVDAPEAVSHARGTAASQQLAVAAATAQTNLQTSGDPCRGAGVDGNAPPGGAKPTAAAGAASSFTDAHVHELAAQASKLRGMSGNVKRLLEIAAGEVQGALEDTRDSLGVATAAKAATAATATAAVGVQTEGEDGPSKESVHAVEEELRGAKAAVQALEAEKLRLEGELSATDAKLAEAQGLLREKTAEALVLRAQAARLEAEGREAREALSAANDRLAEAVATNDAQLSDTRVRLEAALAAQAELRGRCAELSLASGAFAAEVARQKDEHARSRERARLAAEAAAAERGRLERALEATRSEAREIDSDVAQVLDALAASEKERRRLEGEVDRRTRAAAVDAEAAQLAVRADEGVAAVAAMAQDELEGMDRQRQALGEKADRLEGVVELGASRLKESLEREMERRQELEKQCQTLAARATELEAALISASSEVRKAAKIAAERGARHERDAAGLRENCARLKAALEVKTAETEKVAKMEAEARGAMEALERDHRAAIASVVAEAATRARREGKEEERQHTADVLERGDRECRVLRKELSDVTEALRAETRLRAQAAEELPLMQRKVAELETALARATAAEREAAANNPMSQLQAEMRAVISSLEPGKEQGSEERVELEGGRAHQRRSAPCEDGSHGGSLEVAKQQRRQDGEGGGEAGGRHRSRAASAVNQTISDSASSSGRRSIERGPWDESRQLEQGHETINATAGGGSSGSAFGREESGPGYRPASPSAPQRRHDAKVSGKARDQSADEKTPPPPGRAYSAAFPAGASPVAAVDASSCAPADGGRAPLPGRRSSATPVAAQALIGAAPMPLPTGSSHDSNVGDEDVNNDDEDGDDISVWSVQSGVSSATRTSGVSSSLTSAALPLPVLAVPQRPHRGSIVVRGDWKAGQREVFTELDRKASASSASGGGGDDAVGGAFEAQVPA